MFNNPFPNAFGLDISDLSIKVVQLKNASHSFNSVSYQPVVHKSIHLPHGLIVNGEILEPESVRKYIFKLLYGGKNRKIIKGNWVVASLPEIQSFIKHLIIQKPIEEIIDDDIINIAKKHIPFDEDSYYIDWQIVPKRKDDPSITEIIIGAVSKNIANSYTYLLKSIGLGVIALETDSLAISRAMITASKIYEGEARAILDLGATRSSLIVYDHDSIQFSSIIPFSGELITTALSQKLNIHYAEAEKRKIKYGLDCKKVKGRMFQIMTDLINDLSEDLKKTIEFYYSHFPNPNKITHITMCGGTANLSRLEKVLSLKLKISARPGKPWKNLESKKTINMGQTESLSYATAIGLALRAADNPFFKHDII